MTKVSTFKYWKFSEDESGAVTVDWVVLTGAIVGLAFAATIPVFSSTEAASNTASLSLQDAMASAGEVN